jgi:mono/diheme cytochrome c family protein
MKPRKIHYTLAVLVGLTLAGVLQSYEAAPLSIAKADTTLKWRDTTGWPKSFGFGRTASTLEIDAWDIDVRPDGKGLPAGSGTTMAGKLIYQTKCAGCHGPNGQELPNVKLPAPALVSDTAFVGRKSNTLGNYWPYATTIFDYIRRTMPYNLPGSLTNNEVYSVTAYLLSANKIITADKVLNAQTLPQIVMPAQKYFINDDRKGGPEIK